MINNIDDIPEERKKEIDDILKKTENDIDEGKIESISIEEFRKIFKINTDMKRKERE